MIYLKTDEEIELLRESNLLVGMTLGELAKWIAPGITTLKLDKIAEEFIRDHGAVPGFLGYGGFPNTLCVSVNEQIVHGIPSNYELKDGDIVLMHDLYEQSAIAAETLIPELTKRGYQLVTVSEMAELRGGMAAGHSYGHFR